MKPFLLCALFALPSLAAAQTAAPELESIRVADLRADLFFLASDAMQGRLTDTPENRLAAEFIKARFERLGLQPAGPDGSFFQPYNLYTTSLGVGNEIRMTDARGGTQRLDVGAEFYPLNISATGRAQGSLAFAGFGIVSPAIGHDDFRGDVRGKVVLILDHEPGERDPASPFDGVVTSEASRDVRKVLAAQERGAVAVLFVSDVHNHPATGTGGGPGRPYWTDTPRRIERYLLATWIDRIRIPVARIGTDRARAILEAAGQSLDDLSRTADHVGSNRVVPLGETTVALTTAVQRKVVPDRNVVAYLEGSDPSLRDEWIIISAHYDHDGADGERVFAGADDDGSGTVSLLEIAEAYARAAERGLRPRRSIFFAAWNSEERGLLGAWAYTEHPLHPLAQTVAVLNMDMVGRNEEVPVDGGRRFNGLEVQTAASNNNAVNLMGYTYSPDLHASIETANGRTGLDLKARYDNNASQLLRRSDQWPFLQNGVPAMFFHTGLHPDYHTERDRPEKINYAKMEKIARLVYQTSWTLAVEPGRPGFVERRTLIP